MAIPKIKHLESNDEIDNFYNKIVSKVSNLLEEKNYQKALEIINEELSQPYIPVKFFDIFHELKYEINNSLYDQKMEEKYWKKTPEQLIDIICNSNLFIPEYWEVFLEKLEIEEKKIKDYLFQINNIFLSTKIHNSDKFYILGSLINLGVNYIFDYKNSYSNHLCKINTSTIEKEMKETEYQECLEMIYNKYFKDITSYNFATSILQQIQDYYFPIFPFKSVESLFNSINSFLNNAINLNDNNNEQWIKSLDDELLFNAIKILY